MPDSSNAFTEKVAARVDELQDGQMKQIEAGGKKIVLARVGGKFYAMGGTCPHYGAPLAEGLLCGHRLICPWHMGTFDVRSGSRLEPPPLDCLPTYETWVENGKVLLRLPASMSDRRFPEMAAADPKADGRTFAILGAGAAGTAAAQQLRREGFRGRIVLISQEAELPYDRPNLTKEYLSEKPYDHPMHLRPPEFYQQAAIERWHRAAKEVDVPGKVIHFDDNTSLRYDALLLATGGQPRKLGMEGENARGVFYIRSHADADRLRDAARAAKKGARAVIVGSSFIGMESAASLRERGLEIIVVSNTKTPFELQLGPKVGQVFQQLHEEKGVRFEMQQEVKKFETGAGGELVAVLLKSGKRLETSIAVVGVGVKPVTSMLRGIELARDGAVIVDEFLQAADGLFAAGDIARFPDKRTGRALRIEHWRLAEQHGMWAARNMLGKRVAFEDVPYFWSFQFDVGLDYVGYADMWDEIKIDGDPANRDFLACYLSANKILAACGMNRTPTIQWLYESWRCGDEPSLDEVLEKMHGGHG